MSNTVINYFRKNLRKKIKRPRCDRYLALWDDNHWVKRETEINLDYIKANDFLTFLFQTKRDICCVEKLEVQALRNAVDKYFFLLFDVQSYFDTFIKNKIFKNRVEIVSTTVAFKINNYIPNVLISNMKMLELFIDFTKRLEEWAFWKRKTIINLTKIILTPEVFNHLENNGARELLQLMKYIEELFDKGVNQQ